MTVHPRVAEVTERVKGRSRASRALYRERIARARDAAPRRARLSCGNLAHGFAACGADAKANSMAVDPNWAIQRWFPAPSNCASQASAAPAFEPPRLPPVLPLMKAPPAPSGDEL